MKLKLSAQIKQHAGDILLECQDSFDYNIENLAFSISDGVSLSYRPELWSRILTESFVNNPEKFFVEQGGLLKLNPELSLKDKWVELENAAYNKSTEQEKFLLDFKKQRENRGAATFVGIVLKEDGVHYYAIGDSVLFFYEKATGVLQIISSMASNDGAIVFNNSPEYIDTNECCYGKIAHGVLPYKNGIIFLATDALSDWIVERKDMDIYALLKDFMNLNDHSSYDELMDSLRKESCPTKLKDDDTTFIALELSDCCSTGIDIDINYATKFNDLLVCDLESQIKTKTEQLEISQSELSRSERELKKLKKEAQGLETEIKSLKTELETKCGELSDLKSKYRTLKGQHDKYELEIDQKNQAIKRLNGEISELRKEIARLKQENKTASSTIRSLSDDVAKLNRENLQLRDDINKLKKSKPSSPRTVTPPPYNAPTSNPLSDKVRDLERALNKANEENRQIKGLLDRYQTILKGLQEQYSQGDIIAIEVFAESFGTLLDTQTSISKITLEGKRTKDGGFEVL